MRITGQENVNTISKSQTNGVADTPKPAPRTGRAGQDSLSSADQIDLGGQSGLLSLVKGAGSPGLDAHLEQLRALVKSGQYQVDSASLSRSIVSSALDGL